MPLPSLSEECFIHIFSFLDDKSLYNCLLVNRYYCKLSIPIIWSEPFKSANLNTSLIINTLLACLNEDEFSSLVPYAIKFMTSNQHPLFEYGKFVKNIDHRYLTENIVYWLESPSVVDFNDCRIQGLVDVVCHMIIRQGSNLQELSLEVSEDEYYVDFPKLSAFTTYKPGMKNLGTLKVNLYNNVIGQNAIEFLSMVSIFCNGIVNCELWTDELNSTYLRPFLDIIKSQPLRRMFIYIEDYYIEEKDVKNFLYALEFRSNTLKELLFNGFDFQYINLSFIPKLECLKCLVFENCTFKHYGTLFKEKLRLKELRLWFLWYRVNRMSYDYRSMDINLNAIEAVINSLCSETLFKLSLNVVTPETVKAVKESCPNISFLHIKFYQSQFLDSIIPMICTLQSLKILDIEKVHKVNSNQLVKLLGDYLTSVEYLLLNFYVDFPFFEYFTNNCKANLKNWSIMIDKNLRDCYLKCVDHYQRMHNSLKVLEINERHEGGFDWTNEELKIVDSLKNQGVDIVSKYYKKNYGSYFLLNNYT